MKQINYLILFMPVMILIACSQGDKKTENPFFAEYKTPFGVPPFQEIENKHFIPAFEKGIQEQKSEIDVILKNQDEASFENTILALEYSGALLNKVESVFGNLRSSNTNDELQAIAKEMMPKLSSHNDEIFLNEDLFKRVKSVYEKKQELGLDQESSKLLEETYKQFVRRGANLSPEDKEVLMGINKELSLLSLQFGDNVLAETNNFKLVIDNEADLAGLPENVISAAAERAGEPGKWAFTLHSPSWIPFLTYANNRSLREKLYKAMYSRGNNDNEYNNTDIIAKILNLRQKRAKLLGYENHASFALEERMAKNPANVYNLLHQLWAPALTNAKMEAKEMQSIIDREGGNFKLQSWDWWYYAEKVRKEKYNLDEEEIRPYLELNNVRQGAFTLANKLFGIEFKKLENVPLPHPEAEVFEVTEADGSHIGLLYTDYFPRSSKRGGAWMSHFRKQSRTIDGKMITPVITNTCNFSKPTADKPALLSYDEANTLFHEFGHALHGLLSNSKYQSLSGTSTPRDFVELPSQIMENWLPEPEVLKMFAKHYKTGEVIPQELVDKIIAAGKFNQGFATVEYLAASFLDMDYHTLNDAENIDIHKFENTSMSKIGLIEEIIPRYKTSYFNHIWGGGYSAGYYSYIWAEVLDSDAYQAFVESGDIFNPELGAKFRETILSKGGTRDAMEMYLNFRGKEPSIQPLLKKRGLLN